MGLSAGEYLFGLAELAAIVAALAFGAVRVRAWLLPEWTGAPARLVAAVKDYWIGPTPTGRGACRPRPASPDGADRFAITRRSRLREQTSPIATPS